MGSSVSGGSPAPRGSCIFTAPLTTRKPLRMINSGWVTGESGMGHVAITTREPYSLHGYFNTVLTFRLSGYIDENISGLKLKIRFLREMSGTTRSPSPTSGV